jgi:hypothetical protein
VQPYPTEEQAAAANLGLRAELEREKAEAVAEVEERMGREIADAKESFAADVAAANAEVGLALYTLFCSQTPVDDSQHVTM